MRYLLHRVAVALLVLALPATALASPPTYPTNISGVTAPGQVPLVCDASASNCAPASAANPAPSTVSGNVAAGATDSGAPVKAGGIYTATLPTLSDGQRGNVQLTTKGELLVTLYYAGGAIAGTTDNSDGVAVSGSANSLKVLSRPMLFNGTSWDREKKPATVSRLLSSAATTNGASVKASAGDLFRLRGYNTNASARWLKVYNKASAPTVGTDTPVLTFYLAPSAAFDIDFQTPFYLGTGIAYAITGAGADNDTTAIGAGDIVAMNVIYQ